MGRAAEDLERERGGNGADTFVDKLLVRKLRRGDAAQRRAEAHAGIGAGILRGEVQARVVDRLLGENERELCVAVDALELVGRKVLGRVEVVDDPRALGVVALRIEALDKTDARFFAENSFPEAFAAVSDAGKRPNSSDNDA